MSKILIVEKEKTVAGLIKDILEAGNYTVAETALDSKEALRLFQFEQPDLVCLDIDLSGTGIETAKKMREQGNFRLVYLTEHGMEKLHKEAEETFPVGFLVKPVTDKTVTATVEAALTIPFIIESNIVPEYFKYVIRLHDSSEIVFDLSKGIAMHNGSTYSITSTEARLIQCLLERHGEVVPFDILRSLIWQDCVVGEASLKTLVWRIRSKMNGIPLIKTVNGFGYCIEEDIVFAD